MRIDSKYINIHGSSIHVVPEFLEKIKELDYELIIEMNARIQYNAMEDKIQSWKRDKKQVSFLMRKDIGGSSLDRRFYDVASLVEFVENDGYTKKDIDDIKQDIHDDMNAFFTIFSEKFSTDSPNMDIGKMQDMSYLEDLSIENLIKERDKWYNNYNNIGLIDHY